MANPNVGKASYPSGGSLGKKATPNVANLKGSYKNLSGGGGLSSAGGVTLGTTKGNHHVAHPIKGSGDANTFYRKGTQV